MLLNVHEAQLQTAVFGLIACVLSVQCIRWASQDLAKAQRGLNNLDTNEMSNIMCADCSQLIIGKLLLEEVK